MCYQQVHYRVLEFTKRDFKHHLLWGWMDTANHHYILQTNRWADKVLDKIKKAIYMHYLLQNNKYK